MPPDDPHPVREVGKLSSVDRAIIRALQRDGRQSFVEIARAVQVTEKTVRRRVRDLLERDIIEITTVADPRQLGYASMALVGVDLDGSRSVSDVAVDLAAIGAVDYVVATTGRYDILIELLCRSQSDLLSTLEEDVRQVCGIRNTEVFPYLSLHYQEPEWDAAREKNETRARGVESSISLDDVDRSILAMLSDDGRAPLRTVADKVRISESQVRQRVNRMVGSGAVRIMAITNPTTLGFTTLAWLAITVSPGTRVLEVAEALAEAPSVAYLAICAGRYDIYAEAICVDPQDLLRVLETEVRVLPGVSRVEPFIYLELHYKRLRPLV